MKSVLIAAPISNKLKEYLLNHHYNLIEHQPNYDKNNIEGILTSNKLLLDKKTIPEYPALKWIARLGSGMEIIDTQYCNNNNIKYFSSPNGIANSVAEHVIGMILSLLHNIHNSFEEIKKGNWIREDNRGQELSSKTIGIIGYGHTGQALAKKLSVFTDSILVYDKYKSNFSNHFVKECTLEYLQENADIISFHVPLNDETKYYYNDDFFSLMKKNHILINSSRGEIVSTETLLKGLKNKKIVGACLDVIEDEKNINYLLADDNSDIYKILNYSVIMTPHIAGYSHQAIEKMCDELLLQLKSLIESK